MCVVIVIANDYFITSSLLAILYLIYKLGKHESKYDSNHNRTSLGLPSLALIDAFIVIISKKVTYLHKGIPFQSDPIWVY